MVTASSAHELSVGYKDGDKTISVPPGVPVVADTMGTHVGSWPALRSRPAGSWSLVVDLDAVVERLPRDGAAALLCVERDPEACHRSLIAERLASEYGLKIAHIRPA